LGRRVDKGWRHSREIPFDQTEQEEDEEKNRTGRGKKARSCHLIWDECGAVADTSTSCFQPCIIQASNMLAVWRLTRQTVEDPSSCFVYVTPR